MVVEITSPGGSGSTLAIGSSVGSGTATRILFEGTGPVLADSASLTWNDSTKLLTLGVISPATPATLKIWGKDPTNVGFGVGPWCSIDQSVTTSLMAPMTFTTFNPAAAGGEFAFVFNSTYSALGGYYLVDFRQSGVSKFSVANDGSIVLAAGASFTVDTISSNFNRVLALRGGFGSTSAETQPVYQFNPTAGASHGDLIEFYDGGTLYHFIHGADNTFGHANNWGINVGSVVPTAQLHIKAFEDTRKGLLIQGFSATQSGDLTQWTDNSGNVQARIGPKGAISGSLDTMTYAATISLDVTLGNAHKTTTVNATGNATINASAGGNAGQHLWVIITNDATSGKVITFGTNFLSTGTLTGTASKSATVHFISDGTNWFEVSRTLGL